MDEVDCELREEVDLLGGALVALNPEFVDCRGGVLPVEDVEEVPLDSVRRLP